MISYPIRCHSPAAATATPRHRVLHEDHGQFQQIFGQTSQLHLADPKMKLLYHVKPHILGAYVLT
jgi:hypothetical protein